MAVSPGVGFGPDGDGHVRFALIENEQRISQAVRNLRRGPAEAGLRSTHLGRSTSAPIPTRQNVTTSSPDGVDIGVHLVNEDPGQIRRDTENRMRQQLGVPRGDAAAFDGFLQVGDDIAGEDLTPSPHLVGESLVGVGEFE